MWRWSLEATANCVIRALPVCVDQMLVFFKGRHDNEVTAHDWSHLNDTRLQIFGRCFAWQ